MRDQREYLKAWRKRNPDYGKRYYWRNPERQRATARACRNRHRQERNEKSLAWHYAHREEQNRLRSIRSFQAYKKNPERFRLRDRMRYLMNKDAYIAKSNKRRALLRKSTIGCQLAVLKIYERARQLRKYFDVVVDHIIPISRGGSHSAGNLQIIYASENRRKHAKAEYKPTVVFT